MSQRFEDIDFNNIETKPCFFTFFFDGKFDFSYKIAGDIAFIVLYRADVLEEILRNDLKFTTFYGENCWIIFEEVLLYAQLAGGNLPNCLRHRGESIHFTELGYKHSGHVDICFNEENVHKVHDKIKRIEERNF